MAANPSPARERIEERLNAIGRLRGSGPNPFDYNQWYDRTVEVLGALFGPGSAEVERLHEAAGVRGRLPGVRGQAEDMTLNIHGPWGIRARLDRAEQALRDTLAGL
ncbi:MAG: hypothetical protein DYG91_11725 [Chloroflexi bacterium CFX7]|nr:hypothetical protein [Chloroflexi bacterium CFX7]